MDVNRFVKFRPSQIREFPWPVPPHFISQRPFYQSDLLKCDECDEQGEQVWPSLKPPQRLDRTRRSVFSSSKPEVKVHQQQALLCLNCIQVLDLEQNLEKIRHKQKIIKITISAAVMVLAIVGFIILRLSGESPASCYGSLSGMSPLRLCSQMMHRQQNFSSRDLVLRAEFRTNGRCYTIQEVVVCQCESLVYFNKTAVTCEPLRCDPASQILGSFGECHPLKNLKINSETGCPLFLKYSEEVGSCSVTYCPNTFKRLVNGFCENLRNPYLLFQSQSMFDATKSQLYKLPWNKGIPCPRKDAEGERIAFLDVLGQWQCLPPSMRNSRVGEVCKPEEMLMRIILGCRSRCAPYWRFDFFSKACVPGSCQVNERLLASGECQSCNVYTQQVDPCDQPEPPSLFPWN